MQRPSHTISTSFRHLPLSYRLSVIGLAAALNLAAIWGMMHGLGGTLINAIRDIDVVKVPDTVKATPPPPMPKTLAVPLPVPVAPAFTIDIGPTNDGGITIAPPQTPPTVPVRPVSVTPDQGAVAIRGTHTSPPYPLLAQRLGAEGKVTLSLTVLTDGKVGAADVVNSSGREDLDMSAQQWIVAHWTYKPALKAGVPMISKTLVTVDFNLKNAP
jgi:protein TonB